MRLHYLRRGWIVIAVLLLAALACNAPTEDSVSEQQTATALFGTIFPTQSGGPTLGGDPASQQAATPTNPPANSTATNTAAPQQCVGKAKDAVNVRTGPSTFHPILRVLAKDGTGIITGRNDNSSWWQIDGNAWVYADYIETSGSCGSIGVASYPPAPATSVPTKTATPTATATVTQTATATLTSTPAEPVNFTLTYNGSFTCGGVGRAVFALKNIGQKKIESIRYTIEGPVGTALKTNETTNLPFKDVATQPDPDCSQPGSEKLDPENTKYVYFTTSAPAPAAATTGRVKVKACAQDDLLGDCKEITVDFTY
jgi:uncharacterized protein YraI